jgi:hypothetical protein
LLSRLRHRCLGLLPRQLRRQRLLMEVNGLLLEKELLLLLLLAEGLLLLKLVLLLQLLLLPMLLLWRRGGVGWCKRRCSAPRWSSVSPTGRPTQLHFPLIRLNASRCRLRGAALGRRASRLFLQRHVGR